MNSVRNNSLAAALSGLVLLTSVRADIVVVPKDDANSLATALVSGAGVNLVAGSATLTGATLATHGMSSAGTFSGGFSTGTPPSKGIGIESGILLTSGNVLNVTNRNTSDWITGRFIDPTTGFSLGPGDPWLNALNLSVGQNYETYDATALEFKFTFARSGGGNLYFNFAFASDEYNEYANTPFDDVFGFFVDGTNIAVLPGTTTPISVNTINGGNPLGVDPKNPQYFINNERSIDGTSPHPFEYDGFTKVFTASALNLGGGVHTIRLAVADGSDQILDSGVFIQAGSFSNVRIDNDSDSSTDLPTTVGIDFEKEHEHLNVPDSGSSLLLVILGLMILLRLHRRFEA